MISTVFNRFGARRFGLVLLYHGIWERVPQDLGGVIHNVRPEVFSAQIDWLVRHFDVVSIDEFMQLDTVKGKAAITFDDAYRSVFDVALPILRSLRLPATVFVNAGTIHGSPLWRDKVRFLMNNRLVGDFLAWRQKNSSDAPPLDEATFYRTSKTPAINSGRFERQIDAFAKRRGLFDEIQGLAGQVADREVLVDDPLVTYGNHTYSHFLLSSLEPMEQAREIRANQAALERLGLPLSRIFALPFGGKRDFNAETVRILRQDGYAGVVLSRFRVNPARRRSAFFAERWMPPDDTILFHRRLTRLYARAVMSHVAFSQS